MNKFIVFLCMTCLSCTNLSAFCPQDMQDIENYCVFQICNTEIQMRNSKQTDFSKFQTYCQGRIQAYSEIKAIIQCMKKRDKNFVCIMKCYESEK